MDDFIGTQEPFRRLHGAVAVVEELERAVPGLASRRRPAPAGINWAAIEADLGAGLPDDYTLLCELFPTFILDDFLLVGGPQPGVESAWVQRTLEELKIVTEWCADADLTVPLQPYPTVGGLLPWAASNEGDIFLWKTVPADPQAWTVTIASRNGGWWHYTGGAVQFLADLVSGAVEPWELPRVCPEVSWLMEASA
ncbi:SMI1/KNR4 family protein [Streptomyces sp. NPDC052052]|uniref:SMI1/KNR4 family protein n=1 Tax=Streptomyces sp. NPDC052052 TaxID=3154756 RepID=UPI003442917D